MYNIERAIRFTLLDNARDVDLASTYSFVSNLLLNMLNQKIEKTYPEKSSQC